MYLHNGGTKKLRRKQVRKQSKKLRRKQNGGLKIFEKLSSISPLQMFRRKSGRTSKKVSPDVPPPPPPYEQLSREVNATKRVPGTSDGKAAVRNIIKVRTEAAQAQALLKKALAKTKAEEEALKDMPERIKTRPGNIVKDPQEELSYEALMAQVKETSSIVGPVLDKHNKEKKEADDELTAANNNYDNWKRAMLGPPKTSYGYLNEMTSEQLKEEIEKEIRKKGGKKSRKYRRSRKYRTSKRHRKYY